MTVSSVLVAAQAVSSGLVGAVAWRQWQVCWWEQLQGSSCKCFGEDSGGVAVASVDQSSGWVALPCLLMRAVASALVELVAG